MMTGTLDLVKTRNISIYRSFLQQFFPLFCKLLSFYLCPFCPPQFTFSSPIVSLSSSLCPPFLRFHSLYLIFSLIFTISLPLFISLVSTSPLLPPSFLCVSLPPCISPSFLSKWWRCVFMGSDRVKSCIKVTVASSMTPPYYLSHSHSLTHTHTCRHTHSFYPWALCRTLRRLM